MRNTPREFLGSLVTGQRARRFLARGVLIALALSMVVSAQARLDPGESTGAVYIEGRIQSAGAVDTLIDAAATNPYASAWRLAQRLDPGYEAGQALPIAAGGQAGGAGAADLAFVALVFDNPGRARALTRSRIGQFIDRGDNGAPQAGGGSAQAIPTPGLVDTSTRVVREAICPGPWRFELVAGAGVVAPKAVRSLHVCQVVVTGAP